VRSAATTAVQVEADAAGRGPWIGPGTGGIPVATLGRGSDEVTEDAYDEVTDDGSAPLAKL
jgi:hypothetical protein